MATPSVWRFVTAEGADARVETLQSMEKQGLITGDRGALDPCASAFPAEAALAEILFLAGAVGALVPVVADDVDWGRLTQRV